MIFDPSKTFLISYILENLQRSIQTLAYQKYKRGEKVAGEDIYAFCRDNAMTLETGISPATNTMKIVIKDTKERVHIEALEIK